MNFAAATNDVHELELIPAPCEGCAQRDHCRETSQACHALASYVAGESASQTTPRIPNKFYFCRVFES